MAPVTRWQAKTAPAERRECGNKMRTETSGRSEDHGTSRRPRWPPPLEENHHNQWDSTRPSRFLIAEPGTPAHLARLLIRAGDIELNPGPERITRLGDRNYVLLGDSLVRDITNPKWTVRALSGGKPEDITEWIRTERDVVRGARNIAILCGGNSVCSKFPNGPTQSHEEAMQNIRQLVITIKGTQGDANSKVLGNSKRPRAPEQQNKRIAELNTALKERATDNSYEFVGVGIELASSSVWARDGVHLNHTGTAKLAKILRNRCLPRQEQPQKSERERDHYLTDLTLRAGDIEENPGPRRYVHPIRWEEQPQKNARERDRYLTDLILRAGDIEVNPGPKRYVCPVCWECIIDKTKSSLWCHYGGWVHLRCTELQSARQWRKNEFYCKKCKWCRAATPTEKEAGQPSNASAPTPVIQVGLDLSCRSNADEGHEAKRRRARTRGGKKNWSAEKMKEDNKRKRDKRNKERMNIMRREAEEKTEVPILTWNVQRMSVRANNRKRLREQTKYCIRRKHHIVLLNEITAEDSGVFWLGEGRHSAAIIHSRKSAIMLCGIWKMRWVEDGGKKWTGDRVTAVKDVQMRLIAGYQPLWDHGPEARETFYRELEEQVLLSNREEKLIIGTDHNSHIGPRRTEEPC